MALVLANRVQETGTANTTVSFTLTGAVGGFQSFAAVGNTNTTFYTATDASGNWEVGLGTYSTTGPTLTRTTVYASSNSGSAVTFSGTCNIFVTYPSGKSVNLDASGNVSALGTIASGTWQGTTVGVAYGGTGVTASSGANSVMLRDANQNVTINRLNQGSTSTAAAAGTTTLTAASTFSQILTGTGGQTYKLPDATTLTATTAFQFNNNATGTLTIVDNASGAVGTIAPGGAADIALLSNGTVAGTWDVHAYIPENVQWGTNSLALGSTVITGGTWNGGTIQSGYGGTGLTTFTGANNALYSTSASALAAGTLPVAAGGTGVTTTPTNGQLLIGNGTNYTVATLGSGTGISTTTGAGTLTVNNTGVTSITGTTSQVTASASTGGVTLSLPSTINVNTSGSAASLSATLAVASGGTGQTTYTDGQLLIGNTLTTGLTKSTLTAGTAISVTNGNGSISIANTGVTSAVAGTGISVSGATGAVTITNSGVTSLTTSSGLSTNTSATGAVSVTNTGVTSIVAGSGISVSGATGAVTVSSTASGATITGTTAAGTYYVVGTTSTSGSLSTASISNTNVVSYNASTGALSAVSHVSSSDESLKTNWRDVKPDFIEQLAGVKSGVFDRVEGGNTEVGVGAQSLQKVLAEAVVAGEDGLLGVNYGGAALVAAIKLAERVVALEARLAALEK